MTLRLLLTIQVFFSVAGSTSLTLVQAEAPSPASSFAPAAMPSVEASASPTQSPLPLPINSLAPYEQRLVAAQSVKVMMSILGLELGSTLKEAHGKLDELSDLTHPPKEEEEGPEKGEELEHKVLWQLAKTDYSVVFVKSDEKKRITYIHAILRFGKEIPFEKIGETDKAPVQDGNTIAWDVLRPNRPLFRVVANGANRRASSITMFVVKRPSTDRVEDSANRTPERHR
jgi:hypothetical protein